MSTLQEIRDALETPWGAEFKQVFLALHQADRSQLEDMKNQVTNEKYIRILDCMISPKT